MTQRSTLNKLNLVLTENQQKYHDVLNHNDINFITVDGPAGTGKTLLATLIGFQEVTGGTFKKLILIRPAVEAGEKIGFLPGTEQEKIDPYMRPIYDALEKISSSAHLTKLVEKGIIETAVVAFCRGRTFDNSFIIVDEAQNLNFTQLKMIATRLGENSKMILCGDSQQTDINSDAFFNLHNKVISINHPNLVAISLTTKDIKRSKVTEDINNLFS